MNRSTSSLIFVNKNSLNIPTTPVDLYFRDRRGIFLIDTTCGSPVVLLSVGGYSIGRSLGISGDDRTITYSQTATEGDIWMLNLTSRN